MAELTTAQAAELLNCSQSQVGRLVRSGVLKGRALSARMYLLDKRSVEAYAAKTPTRGWKRGRPRKTDACPMPEGELPLIPPNPPNGA